MATIIIYYIENPCTIVNALVASVCRLCGYVYVCLCAFAYVCVRELASAEFNKICVR